MIYSELSQLIMIIPQYNIMISWCFNVHGTHCIISAMRIHGKFGHASTKQENMPSNRKKQIPKSKSLGFVWKDPNHSAAIYGYGSIPINTFFRGMNIHLPAILMFTRGTRFWHTAIWETMGEIMRKTLILTKPQRFPRRLQLTKLGSDCLWIRCRPGWIWMSCRCYQSWLLKKMQ